MVQSISLLMYIQVHDVREAAIVQRVSAVLGSTVRRCVSLSCRRERCVIYQREDYNIYSTSCARVRGDLYVQSKILIRGK